MKKLYSIKLFVIIYFFLNTVILYTGQTSQSSPSQIRANLSTSQRQNLQVLSNRLKETYNTRRNLALQKAAQKNWVVRKVFDDGRVIELQYLDDDGKPMYYQTLNLNAAYTSSVDKIWSGGSLGLNLSGSGILIGEWDGGKVRTTHQEFGGRVTQQDGAATLSSHATHVAGTIIASGISAGAKGMSYAANLDAYDWNSDLSEMASAAADGLLISNHSYGFIAGWYDDYRNDGKWVWFGDTNLSMTEDNNFGLYNNNAKNIDEIVFNSPYYLPVWAAGNDRGGGPNSGDVSGGWWVWENDWVWVNYDTVPEHGGGADGYDCIAHEGLAKNILSVGAVDDIPAGWSQRADVKQDNTYFSSWGPADDGRIKPDLVANGWNLYSANSGSDNDYIEMPGTSMAAPTVTGTLGLLIQHYANTHNSATMKAATLKALVLNTVYEAGDNTGPDYRFGWGLLNAEGAANLISKNFGGSAQLIREESLTNSLTDEYIYYSNGAEPIKVMLVWNDTVPSSLPSGLNPRDKMLVNDLDLRITDAGATTYKPWTLDVENPANPAVKDADNNTDNVEQVYIANPLAGYYTISVSHKGTLEGGFQDYSMVVSGLSAVETKKLSSALGGEYYYVGASGNTQNDYLKISVNLNRAFQGDDEPDVYIVYLKTSGVSSTTGVDWNGTHNLPDGFNYAITIRPVDEYINIRNASDGFAHNDNNPNFAYSSNLSDGMLNFEIALSEINYQLGSNIGFLAYHINGSSGYLYGVAPDNNPTGAKPVSLTHYWIFNPSTNDFYRKEGMQSEEEEIIISENSKVVISDELISDTVYNLVFNNSDTADIFAGNSSGTWGIQLDFADTGNSVRLNKVTAATMNSSDTSRIRNYSAGEGLAIELKAFNSQSLNIGDTLSNVSLMLDYTAIAGSVNESRLALFRLNTSDSIWYNVLDASQPFGAKANSVIFNNNLMSADLKHLSNFFIGEMSDDTATVSGNIILGGSVGDTENLNVYFYSYPENILISADSTTAAGEFSLIVYADSTGYIRVGGDSYLYRNFDTFTVSIDTNVGNLTLLYPGDLTGENKINIFDASRAKAGGLGILDYIRSYFGRVGQIVGEW